MNQKDLIYYSYTRKQALKDGLQVCVSDLFPNDTRMYKYPVYFTQQVWELCQGKRVIVWDICYMAARKSKAQRNDSSVVEYSVIVERANKAPDFLEDDCPYYTLWAECGARDIDDPTPVITIMFPEER